MRHRMFERLVLVGSLMMSASVAVFAETAPNDARGNGLVTVESVLEQWGRAGGPRPKQRQSAS